MNVLLRIAILVLFGSPVDIFVAFGIDNASVNFFPLPLGCPVGDQIILLRVRILFRHGQKQLLKSSHGSAKNFIIKIRRAVQPHGRNCS